ncbi:MAG: VanZ family protein [Christensenellaceae bacterium]|jgi:glycopeptide antibiotics resistance protein|nr:VanZ family protein [Christensenellaceae bacterium]
MRKTQKSLITTLFALYALLLAGVILFKLPFYSDFSERARVVNLVPFQGVGEGAARHEILLNILLFVPFGLYLSMLRGEWPFFVRLLPIFAASLAFELLQFAFGIGISDLSDLIGNTLGGALGIGAFALLRRLLKGRVLPVLSAFALAATGYALVCFGYLFFLSHFVMAQPQ